MTRKTPAAATKGYKRASALILAVSAISLLIFPHGAFRLPWWISGSLPLPSYSSNLGFVSTIRVMSVKKATK